MEDSRQPVSDLIASQGIAAVSCGIALCVLHLTAPDSCAAVLSALRSLMLDSPPPAELIGRMHALLLKWFA